MSNAKLINKSYCEIIMDVRHRQQLLFTDHEVVMYSLCAPLSAQTATYIPNLILITSANFYF